MLLELLYNMLYPSHKGVRTRRKKRTDHVQLSFALGNLILLEEFSIGVSVRKEESLLLSIFVTIVLPTTHTFPKKITLYSVFSLISQSSEQTSFPSQIQRKCNIWENS